MATKADEITRKLLDQQRARVADTEAKLAEERKKLEWMESMAGDLRKAIEDSVGETAPQGAAPKDPTKKQPPKPSATAPAPTEQSAKVLRQHEILDFVDRMTEEFTPQDLCVVIESSSPFKVALAPLQVSLSRMAKSGKGVRQTEKGGRWGESRYASLSKQREEV
jgi:hypothetical protein